MFQYFRSVSGRKNTGKERNLLVSKTGSVILNILLVIRLKSVVMRYQAHLPQALKGVSLTTKVEDPHSRWQCLPSRFSSKISIDYKIT